ncbi:MAG: 4Fe-4S binding protein [Spirochaetes bacterium]|nr:4Fe-4S binding protein [Spirochaetota bacterium]
MSEQVWLSAANAVIRAGMIPMPLTDTILELIKSIITENQARFLSFFSGSMNRDQISEKSGMSGKELDTMLESLMDCGVITGTRSRGTGTMIYRLMGPFPGIFEFTMMRGGTGEKEKRQARLFDRLFDELADLVQKNYDQVIAATRSFKPVARVVPIDSEIDRDKDVVLPMEEVNKIVDKFDTIAVTTCYCRHEKELLGDPCKVTNEKNNCLMFGKIAEFAMEHRFARPISKEDARRVLRESEEAGLVHKAFHVNLDPDREEEAICNCCKCCCGTFQMYYKGAAPLHNLATFMASVDKEACTGCALCEEKCPMEAIVITDGIASVIEDKCIGCGVCASQCGQDAIHIRKTELRHVFVPPVRK